LAIDVEGIPVWDQEGSRRLVVSEELVSYPVRVVAADMGFGLGDRLRFVRIGMHPEFRRGRGDIELDHLFIG
jgi:hypothetical protein